MKKNLLSLAIMFLISIPAFCQTTGTKTDAESIMEAYTIYILIGLAISICCTALGVYWATAANFARQQRLAAYQNRLIETMLKNQGLTDEAIIPIREGVLKPTDPT